MEIQNMITTIFEICILAQIRGVFFQIFYHVRNLEKNVQKRRFFNSRGHGNSKHDKCLLRQMGFQFFAAVQSRFEERYYF